MSFEPEIRAFVAFTLELRQLPRDRRREYRDIVCSWCAQPDYFQRWRRVMRRR